MAATSDACGKEPIFLLRLHLVRLKEDKHFINHRSEESAEI